MKKEIALKTEKDNSITLIAVCWLVYACSYIGKLGYSANIIQIENLFGVSHSAAGIVTTFFFFSYGVGQVINGIFCKKYPLKFVVFAALVVSALCNVTIGFVNTFTILKYVWLVNGFSLSILWPSLIRFLAENVSEKHMSKAIIAMGTTVATGTVVVYAASALFVYLNVFKAIFYLAGALLPTVAVVWLIAYPKKDIFSNKEQIETEQTTKPSLIRSGLLMPIAILAFFAIITNLTKDGLTTWIPSILNDLYSLDAHFSILLSLLLPIMAIFGVSLAVVLKKKVPDFVNMASIFFAITALLIGLALALLHTGIALPLISLALVSLVMSAVNNIITSMAPLSWKDKVNSGMLAGVLDGFCYVGSAISSYGLGYVADKGGWSAVFWLLLIATLFCSVLGAVIFTISRIRKKQTD